MSPPTTKAPLESSFTVGWICVFQKESLAARKLLYEEYTDEGIIYARDDNGQYILGRIGNHNVLRLVLLVGIGGGVKSKDHDVRPGDIVLGTKIIPYRFGKELEHGFKYTGDSIKPPRELMGVFTSLEEKVRDGLSLAKEIADAAKRFDVCRRADYARPKKRSLIQA
ncbi:unnamed protein product [Clonostachys chloroleuca]|uniref:Nucleoside phosphorylase domain-containing protein n=1 Tax=Clonostachys chloroleuca TaxID=1926264 RepID=A0AA35MD24_9HYPO|nr:unnamed protein product [Clonostachys chloroleuca]